MKKSVIAILGGLLLMTTSLTAQTVTGNKDYQTKKITLENFNKLIVNGSPDVYYTQTSGAPSAEIYASSNIIPLIETNVSNGTLTVQFKRNTSIRNSGKIEIKVSGPALSEAKVHGSGGIYLTNGIDTQKLHIYVNGSGDISGKKISCNELLVNVRGSGDAKLDDVKASACKAKVNGSGDIYLSGTVVEAEYSVNGSGDIHAADLKAEDVSAHVNGSGDIKLHATRKLKGKVNGSGDVGYKGNPEIDFSKKGLHRL